MGIPWIIAFAFRYAKKMSEEGDGRKGESASTLGIHYALLIIASGCTQHFLSIST